MKELLEKIKPYKKHNLYTGIYKVDEDGCVHGIPDNAKWEVAVYVGYSEKMGMGFFDPFDKGDIIVLMLHDTRNSFLPVISFLTKEEAKKLAQELLAHIGEGGEESGDEE